MGTVGGGRPTDLLVVAGEPLWPASREQPLRVGGLVGALARRFSVRVVAPVDGPPPGDGPAIAVHPFPDEEPAGWLVAALSPQSRLGRALLGPVRSRTLLAVLAEHGPRAVLFANAAVAAASPSIDRPVFVDFASMAVRRSPGGSALDAFKARWWEPVEARRASAVSASTAEDVDLLASWGARAVLVPDASSVAGWDAACGPLVAAIDLVVRPAED